MDPTRPTSRLGFEIAIICALAIEADAVEALFDQHWDDEHSFGKASGDHNAYTTGSIGRHNVVLAHMPGMGKANAAIVAANCRTSFPNIKLALVVGICGAMPLPNADTEIILGDIIISNGVVQYDLGRRLPERFIRKNTLLESLSRPALEIRTPLGKLERRRSRMSLKKKIIGNLEKLQKEPDLQAQYPGPAHDKLYEASYRHLGDGETWGGRPVVRLKAVTPRSTLLNGKRNWTREAENGREVAGDPRRDETRKQKIDPSRLRWTAGRASEGCDTRVHIIRTYVASSLLVASIGSVSNLLTCSPDNGLAHKYLCTIRP